MLHELANLSLSMSVSHIQGKERGKASNKLLCELYKKIILEIKPEVFFEIGAREAVFTYNLSGLLDGTSFYCMEANPNSYFKYRVRFQGKQNVAYINLAISDRDGVCELKIPAVSTPDDLCKGNSSLAARSEANVDYVIERVPCMTLDGFSKSVGGGRCAAWIDVEGWFSVVHKGGMETFRSMEALLLEVEEVPIWEGQVLDIEVFRMMAEMDFIPIARDKEYAHQYNVIFVKKNLLQAMKKYTSQFQAGLHAV